MDSVNQLDMTPGKREIFNNWRLYFGVHTLSQITNYEGDKILDRYIKKSVVQVNNVQKVTHMKWPTQVRPSMKTFTIWRSVIINISECDYNGNLYNNKMGNWIPGYHHEIKIYSLIYHNRNHIAVLHNNKWKIHNKSHNIYSQYY
jgi:hypothetical protein